VRQQDSIEAPAPHLSPVPEESHHSRMASILPQDMSFISCGMQAESNLLSAQLIDATKPNCASVHLAFMPHARRLKITARPFEGLILAQSEPAMQHFALRQPADDLAAWRLVRGPARTGWAAASRSWRKASTWVCANCAFSCAVASAVCNSCTWACATSSAVCNSEILARRFVQLRSHCVRCFSSFDSRRFCGCSILIHRRTLDPGARAVGVFKRSGPKRSGQTAWARSQACRLAARQT